MNQIKSQLFTDFDNECEILKQNLQLLQSKSQSNDSDIDHIVKYIFDDFFANGLPSRYITSSDLDKNPSIMQRNHSKGCNYSLMLALTSDATDKRNTKNSYRVEFSTSQKELQYPILLLELERHYWHTHINHYGTSEPDTRYSNYGPTNINTGDVILDLYESYQCSLVLENNEIAMTRFNQLFAQIYDETSRILGNPPTDDSILFHFTCDRSAYFLWYAMFLFNVKCKKARKYFEHCLYYRPLNGYLHYQYSLYLFKIIKDYKLSCYHLRIAKKLNPNMYVFSKQNEYEKCMKLLVMKLNKQHICDCNECNKVLSTLNTCKGCRCVYYCSKKCQKKDWKANHRNTCVSKMLEEPDKNQFAILKRVQYLIKCWLSNVDA